MKTLDEVIRWYENRKDILIGKATKEEMEDSVVHYLKEYRAEKDDLERTKKMCFEFVGSKMIEAEKQGRSLICPNCGDEFIILPESNDPLSWSELKQMKGKPVWVESHEDITRFTGWTIVKRAKSDRVHFVIGDWDGDFFVEEIGVPECTYGKTWQAYRKERE